MSRGLRRAPGGDAERLHDLLLRRYDKAIGAAGPALPVPFAILAVGTPVACGVRGLLEATDWLLAIIR